MGRPNVMLDLETTGNAPNSAIIEIGACIFSSKEGVFNPFNAIISLDSCTSRGLVTDKSTMEWWGQQKKSTRDRLFHSKGALELEDALKRFKQWLPKDSIVWGNGSDFDNVILSNAYRTVGQPLPWHFANNRCFRTFKNIFYKVKAPYRTSTEHSATDDAIHQAEWALKIYREVWKKTAHLYDKKGGDKK